MSNYIDAHMRKYIKYNELLKTDLYNSRLYNYKIRKYSNRLIDELNHSIQKGGGSSVQLITDTYFTNINIRDLLKKALDMIRRMSEEIGRKKAELMRLNQENSTKRTELTENLVLQEKLLDTLINYVNQNDLDQMKFQTIQTSLDGLNSAVTNINISS